MGKHATRRAPHMEGYVKVTRYPTDEHPKAHQVQLKIGNQSFLLSDGTEAYYETRREAVWVRDMLCIALDTLVKECTALTPSNELQPGVAVSIDSLKKSLGLKERRAKLNK